MLNPFRTGLSIKRGSTPTDDPVEGNAPAELDEEQLGTASGGADDPVKSPRDAGSGLATGRRSHSTP